MENSETLLSSERLDESPYQTAQKILRDLEYTKTSELSERISLAAEIFAEASGYCILPCPKWETRARAYRPTESRNYIIGFASSVALDIHCYEMHKDGADAWLKSIRKEWVAEQAKEKMLWAFDSAYEKWRERKVMSAAEISESRRMAVERYNRTFREDSNMGRGIFFADQLEKICS